MNRKWKIKKNNKEEVQFETRHKATGAGVKEKNKKRTFRQELKRAFTWLQFDEFKQTMFCTVYREISSPCIT